MEERIRFGKPIFPEILTEDTRGVSLEDNHDSVHVDLKKVENIENADSMEVAESVHEYLTMNKVENIEKGEFHMKFKSKVKSRGRPKGSSRVKYCSKKKRGFTMISKNRESTKDGTDTVMVKIIKIVRRLTGKF